MSAQEKEPKGKEPKGGRRARINLFIAPALDDELERLSEQLGLGKPDFTRRLIKIGLELHKAATDPERGVYFKEAGKEPERIRPFI